MNKQFVKYDKEQIQDNNWQDKTKQKQNISRIIRKPSTYVPTLCSNNINIRR